MISGRGKTSKATYFVSRASSGSFGSRAVTLVVLATMLAACSSEGGDSARTKERALTGAGTTQITDTQNEPVVHIQVKGVGWGSGVLLASDLVLTAAHVVEKARQNPDLITVYHGRGTDELATEKATKVATHKSWTGGAPSIQNLDDVDLALVKLAAPLASFQSVADPNFVAFSNVGLTVAAGPCSLNGFDLVPGTSLCSATGTVSSTPVPFGSGNDLDLRGKYAWLESGGRLKRGDSGAPVYFQNCPAGGPCFFGPGIGASVSGNIRYAEQTRTGNMTTSVSVDLLQPLAFDSEWIRLTSEELGRPTPSECFAPFRKSSVAPHVVCATKKNKTASLDLRFGYEEGFEAFSIPTDGFVVDDYEAVVPLGTDPSGVYPRLVAVTDEAVFHFASDASGPFLQEAQAHDYGSALTVTVAATDASATDEIVISGEDSRDALYVSAAGGIDAGNAIAADIDNDSLPDTIVYDAAANRIRVRPTDFNPSSFALQASMAGDPNLRIYAFPVQRAATYSNTARDPFADHLFIHANGNLMFCASNGFGGFSAACQFFPDMPPEEVAELHVERSATSEFSLLLAQTTSGAWYQWESTGTNLLPGEWVALGGAHRGQEEGVTQFVGGSSNNSVGTFWVEEPKNENGDPTGEDLFIEIFDLGSATALDINTALTDKQACVRMLPDPETGSHPCDGDPGGSLSSACLSSPGVVVASEAELGDLNGNWLRVFGNQAHVPEAADTSTGIHRYRLEVLQSSSCAAGASASTSDVNAFRLRTNGDVVESSRTINAPTARAVEYVALVLDQTGSMTLAGVGDGTRWDDAVSAISAGVELDRQAALFDRAYSIWTFKSDDTQDGVVQIWPEASDTDCDDFEASTQSCVLPAGDDDAYFDLLLTLEGVREDQAPITGPSTPLAQSLCDSLDAIRAIPALKRIVLQSDGGENVTPLTHPCGGPDSESFDDWVEARIDWGMSYESWQAKAVRRAVRLGMPKSFATQNPISEVDTFPSDLVWQVGLHYALVEQAAQTSFQAAPSFAFFSEPQQALETYGLGATVARRPSAMSFTFAAPPAADVDIKADELNLFRAMGGVPGWELQEFARSESVSYGQAHLIPGDADDSGCVDQADLSMVMQADVWMRRAVEPNQLAIRVDLNRDSWVNYADVTLLLHNWGVGCINSVGEPQGDRLPLSSNFCASDVLDGDETDVDCGGSCIGCYLGGTCEAPDDCLSGTCQSGYCDSEGLDACACRPDKCFDCAAPRAACEAIVGCMDIVACVQENPCSFPHEKCTSGGASCFDAVGSSQSSRAGQAANNLISCFGGCSID